MSRQSPESPFLFVLLQTTTTRRGGKGAQWNLPQQPLHGLLLNLPAKAQKKIHNYEDLGFFFNLLSQKFLIFRTKPNLTSPGLPIPNEAHPRTRRHVENLWNYPQHDSDRMKRRAQEEGGVWKESASRAEQNAKGFFLLSGEQQEGRDRQGQPHNFKWQQCQVTLEKHRKGSRKSSLGQAAIPHK